MYIFVCYMFYSIIKLKRRSLLGLQLGVGINQCEISIQKTAAEAVSGEHE